MLKNEGKKFFLVASADMARKKKISDWINYQYPDAVIYTASDYMECLVKIKNAPPNLLITDYDIPKAKPGQIIENIMSDPLSKVGMLVLGSKPKTDNHVDAVAIGKLAFIEKADDTEALEGAIAKIANYTFQPEAREFKLKFLKAGETLIKEGDTSQHIYIVRKGELQAFKAVPGGQRILLGSIQMGEFVGEMAYFNSENRMASVEATTDCELIEIPPQTFEKVIYQRPSWVKTLFLTLSKRLKRKASVQK